MGGRSKAVHNYPLYQRKPEEILCKSHTQQHNLIKINEARKLKYKLKNGEKNVWMKKIGVTT